MVLIVGAGPAGATAARALGRAGVTVRLLDRSNFPRNKPCGGGISTRVLKRFPYLERQLPRIATHTVSRLHLEGPAGNAATIDAGEPAALLVRRVEFDQLLVSLAVEAGAELVCGVDIVQAVETRDGISLTSRDGRRFDGTIVIAADGVHSATARRLGMRTGWPAAALALDMMEETPRAELRDVDPSALWVSYGYEPAPHAAASRPAREGYAYIFPKRDHVNIGVGYVLDHYRSTLGSTTSPYALQRGLVSDLRRRGIVEGESVRGNFTPFLIPVGGPLRRPGRGRVLLAGDAGGFVNGFTAEGIYYAMVSGDLAAKAIIETGPTAISTLAGRYNRACSREMGAELRDSVLLQRYMFADPSRIAALIAGAQRERVLTRLVLDFVCGRITYLGLRRSMLARAPLLAARLVWQRLRTARLPGAAAAVADGT
jgi:geranylgeranyl reductase family protein